MENNPSNAVDPLGLSDCINLFPTKDPIYTNTQTTPLPPGSLVVAGHGNSIGMIRQNGIGYYTSKEMTQYITNRPSYNTNMPVYFLSCNLGVGCSNSPAAYYVRSLPNPTYAGTNFVWVGSNINYFADGTNMNKPVGFGPTNCHPVGPHTPWVLVH